MLSVEINQSDLKNINSILNGLNEKISTKGRSEFLKRDVYPYARGRIGRRFGSQGDDVSGPWKPLKDSTIHYREMDIRNYGFRIRPSEPINIRSFAMFDHLMNSHSFASPSGVAKLTIPGPVRMGQMAASVDSMRKKLQTAQVGDPKRDVPARPVLGMNSKDQDDIEILAIKWIFDGMRGK